MGGTEWDPFEELTKVQKRMNRLFEAALSRADFDTEGVGSWSPAADVLEAADTVLVRVDLPGIRREDLDLSVSGGDLIVSGDRPMEREREGERFHRVERSYGRFSRRLRLPESADADGIRATFRDGVLDIVIPKSTARGSSSRTVPVEVH